MRHSTKGLEKSYWDKKENKLLHSFDELNIAANKENDLKILETKFPGSLRVNILRGKALEANKNFKEARNHYNKLLDTIDEKHELRSRTERIVMKRRYAMKKSQGKLQEAADELSKYLSVYQSDSSAWHELGLLNLENLDYTAAIFCFEEVLMIDPSNNTVYQLLAECLLSTGDKEAEIARTYAATALFSATKNQKKFNSIRSEVTILLASHKNKGSQDKDLNSKLNSFAAKEISKSVEKQSSNSLKQAFLEVIKSYKIQ